MRTFTGFISFTDFAPTFLDIAGVNPESSGMEPMEGRSLTDILRDDKDAKGRDLMVISKECHDVGRLDDHGYPIRGIIQDGWLYIKNFHPERWAADDPFSYSSASPPNVIYRDINNSPTKTYMYTQYGETDHFTTESI